MNNARRKRLEKASEIIDEVLNEEQETFDNIPENLIYSEKGEIS